MSTPPPGEYPGQPPQAPQAPQPPKDQYGSAPAYSGGSASSGDATAGKTLGIVGLILAFLAPPIGLILSIVALVQSKNAGVKNTLAKVGLILSIVFIVLGIIITIALVAVGASAVSEVCGELGSGTHTSGSTTITCP
jgi:preprotein translocase subunit SecG